MTVLRSSTLLEELDSLHYSNEAIKYNIYIYMYIYLIGCSTFKEGYYMLQKSCLFKYSKSLYKNIHVFFKYSAGYTFIFMQHN